ncbi:MAG TPA: hypothetical protein VMT56_03445 [Candidatus Bathyarchaeia archaeon]|nr:hypothetical protein [Dongiaceae bacterium]HVP50257.1 hypothetical protein [Candidatus Bathyarchaeia archaeon]
MIKLGGVVHFVARLGATKPSTLDTFHVLSVLCTRLPKETRFDAKWTLLPGGVASRSASSSPVIWCASISMNPEPFIPIVIGIVHRDKLASFIDGSPGGNQIVMIERQVVKPLGYTNTSVTRSPPPPVTGALWRRVQELASVSASDLSLDGKTMSRSPRRANL